MPKGKWYLEFTSVLPDRFPDEQPRTRLPLTAQTASDAKTEAKGLWEVSKPTPAKFGAVELIHPELVLSEEL